MQVWSSQVYPCLLLKSHTVQESDKACADFQQPRHLIIDLLNALYVICLTVITLWLCLKSNSLIHVLKLLLCNIANSLLMLCVTSNGISFSTLPVSGLVVFKNSIYAVPLNIINAKISVTWCKSVFLYKSLWNDKYSKKFLFSHSKPHHFSPSLSAKSSKG